MPTGNEDAMLRAIAASNFPPSQYQPQPQPQLGQNLAKQRDTVHAALDSQQNEALVLATVVDELTALLQPLMEPDSPSSDASGPQGAPPSSNVLSRIRNTETIVSQTRYRLQSVMRRLQL